MGFLCPLDGGTIVEENQRADDFITPLNRITEELLELVKVRQWLHGWSLPCWSSWTSGSGRPGPLESLVRRLAKVWGKERAYGREGEGGKRGARHPLAPSARGL